MIANLTNWYLRKQTNLLSCALMAITLTFLGSASRAQDRPPVPTGLRYENPLSIPSFYPLAAESTPTGSTYLYVKVAFLVALVATMIAMLWIVSVSSGRTTAPARPARKRYKRRASQHVNPSPNQPQPPQAFAPASIHVGCFAPPMFGTPIFSTPITTMPSIITPQLPYLQIASSPLQVASSPIIPHPYAPNGVSAPPPEPPTKQDQWKNNLKARAKNRRRREDAQPEENSARRPLLRKETPVPVETAYRRDLAATAPRELTSRELTSRDRAPREMTPREVAPRTPERQERGSVANEFHASTPSTTYSHSPPNRVTTTIPTLPPQPTRENANHHTQTTPIQNQSENSAATTAAVSPKPEPMVSRSAAKSRDPLTSMFQKIVDENIHLKATRQQST